MQLAASSSSYHGRPVARRSHPEIELRSTARRRIGADAAAELSRGHRLLARHVTEPGEAMIVGASGGFFIFYFRFL